MQCAPLGEVSVRDVVLRTSSDAAEKVADAATAAAADGGDCGDLARFCCHSTTRNDMAKILHFLLSERAL
jgi:hypothetical protein